MHARHVISAKSRFGLTPPPRWRVSANTCALVLLLAAGCAADADNGLAVPLDQEFQLKMGQQALVSPDNITVGFKSVSGDSRCAKGEVCITEGDATVQIWLQMGTGPVEEHELHTTQRLPTATDFGNFSIRLLALHPARISGHTIEQSDYVATLRVVRGMSGGKIIY